MAKKDEAKKTVTKTGRSVKGVTAKTAGAKAPAKTPKKAAAAKRPVKARTKPKTTFKLEAPHAAEVFIVGSFNGWNLTANPLKKNREGTWACALAIEPGEHEYRFLVDEIWWDDPANPARRWNEFGTQNCIIIVEE